MLEAPEQTSVPRMLFKTYIERLKYLEESTLKIEEAVQTHKLTKDSMTDLIDDSFQLEELVNGIQAEFNKEDSDSEYKQRILNTLIEYVNAIYAMDKNFSSVETLVKEKFKFIQNNSDKIKSSILNLVSSVKDIKEFKKYKSTIMQSLDLLKIEGKDFNDYIDTLTTIFNLFPEAITGKELTDAIWIAMSDAVKIKHQTFEEFNETILVAKARNLGFNIFSDSVLNQYMVSARPVNTRSATHYKSLFLTKDVLDEILEKGLNEINEALLTEDSSSMVEGFEDSDKIRELKLTPEELEDFYHEFGEESSWGFLNKSFKQVGDDVSKFMADKLVAFGLKPDFILKYDSAFKFMNFGHFLKSLLKSENCDILNDFVYDGKTFGLIPTEWIKGKDVIANRIPVAWLESKDIFAKKVFEAIKNDDSKVGILHDLLMDGMEIPDDLYKSEEFVEYVVKNLPKISTYNELMSFASKLQHSDKMQMIRNFLETDHVTTDELKTICEDVRRHKITADIQDVLLKKIKPVINEMPTEFLQLITYITVYLDNFYDISQETLNNAYNLIMENNWEVDNDFEYIPKVVEKFDTLKKFKVLDKFYNTDLINENRHYAFCIERLLGAFAPEFSKMSDDEKIEFIEKYIYPSYKFRVSKFVSDENNIHKFKAKDSNVTFSLSPLDGTMRVTFSFPDMLNSEATLVPVPTLVNNSQKVSEYFYKKSLKILSPYFDITRTLDHTVKTSKDCFIITSDKEKLIPYKRLEHREADPVRPVDVSEIAVFENKDNGLFIERIPTNASIKDKPKFSLFKHEVVIPTESNIREINENTKHQFEMVNDFAERMRFEDERRKEDERINEIMRNVRRLQEEISKIEYIIESDQIEDNNCFLEPLKKIEEKVENVSIFMKSNKNANKEINYEIENILDNSIPLINKLVNDYTNYISVNNNQALSELEKTPKLFKDYAESITIKLDEIVGNKVYWNTMNLNTEMAIRTNLNTNGQTIQTELPKQKESGFNFDSLSKEIEKEKQLNLCIQKLAQIVLADETQKAELRKELYKEFSEETLNSVSGDMVMEYLKIKDMQREER